MVNILKDFLAPLVTGASRSGQFVLTERLRRKRIEEQEAALRERQITSDARRFGVDPAGKPIDQVESEIATARAEDMAHQRTLMERLRDLQDLQEERLREGGQVDPVQKIKTSVLRDWMSRFPGLTTGIDNFTVKAAIEDDGMFNALQSNAQAISQQESQISPVKKLVLNNLLNEANSLGVDPSPFISDNAADTTGLRAAINKVRREGEKAQKKSQKIDEEFQESTQDQSRRFSGINEGFINAAAQDFVTQIKTEFENTDEMFSELESIDDFTRSDLSRIRSIVKDKAKQLRVSLDDAQLDAIMDSVLERVFERTR